MASEWPEYSLNDISELIVDCPHSTPEWTDEGVVVLRNQYIRNGRLDLSAPSYTTEEGYRDRIKRAVPTAGDLVLTREAPMGEVCQIPEGLRCCLGQRMVLVRANKQFVDPKYLLFVIQSPYLQHQISWNEGTGTTVSNIRIPNLKAFRIPTPPLDEQKAIAHILGALDDKIELNRQMNATLEAMAQALFKSWLVDFDPVIDNALAAGNPIPKPLYARAEARRALGDQRKPLPEAIQKHFPDRFVFNEDMGWVPEGWEPASIYSLLDVVYGAPFKSKLFNDECFGKPIIRIRDLKTGTPQVWSDEVHPKGTLIKRGDVVVGMDAEFRATLWPGDEGWLNQRLFLARPTNTNTNSFYIQKVLDPLLAQEENAQVGTTVAHLGKKDIDKFVWLKPPAQVMDEYSAQTNEALSRWVNIHQQTQALTRLRDTLLPKLLSGQLRIPDAEKQVAEAI